MANRTVDDLADAVADGRAVDWRAAESRLTDPDDRDLASALRTISDLAAARPAESVNPVARLSFPLEAARLVAIPIVSIGVIGIVGALWRTGSPAGITVLSVLLAFVAAAVYLDLGGGDRRARALSTLYWTLAASLSANGVGWLARAGPAMAWLGALTALRPEAFFAASLWQFAREFPSITVFSRIDRIASAGVQASVVLGVALFVANLLPAEALPVWASALRRSGSSITLFWLLSFVVAIPALLVMAWRARLARERERARVRLFLYAVAACIGPLLVLVIAEGLFPPLARVMSSPGARTWGGLIVYPPLLALPVVTAYVISTHDVLTIRVVIHRGLRYLLAKWFIAWGAVVPWTLLLMHLYRHADRPLADAFAASPGRSLAVASIVAGALLAFRTALVRALDRLMLDDADDPSAMLARITEQLKDARTPLEVIAVLATQAERALQAPADPFLIVNGALVPVNADSGPGPEATVIPVLLGSSHDPCVVSSRHRNSYHALMTASDRAWIARREVAILVPILSSRRQGELIGVIALLNRRNALAFSDNDLRLLRAASSAASLACDAIKPGDVAESSRPTEEEEVAAECEKCGALQTWEVSRTGACTCGGSFQPAALPKRLGSRFELEQRLGAGGMGVVYRGVDLTLRRDVAIKTLSKLSEEPAQRLIAEARTMAVLPHPQIAVLYGTEIWRDTPLLIMECLDGGTLAQRLRRGRCSLPDTIEIGRLLAIALEHVHAAGRFHGDIKPSNIGFTAHGIPKFLDFGLSKVIAEQRADDDRAAGPVAGTLAYMSPDVRGGARPGPDLDVWALSLVLYEAVIGRNPVAHVRSPAAVAHTLQTVLSQLPADVDAAIGPLLRRALLPDTRGACRAADMVAALTHASVS